MNNIRNFVIIAHIDHGKSTLADRFLELTHTVEARQMKAQYLDQLELERERGITIKMAPVRMLYRPSELEIRNWKLDIKDSEFILNLIDTPGHSDFSYEVSRALKAVEGAILLVDGTQGIQAQTLANYHFAKVAGLKIIGAVNKIDMNPPALPEVIKSLAELLGYDEKEIHKVSAKTGEGVEEILEDIVLHIPPPKPQEGNSALIFDSFYDDHKGVIAHVRVFGGEFMNTEETKLIAVNHKFKIKETGYFSPSLTPGKKLHAGEIGYIATGVKDPDKIKIGDTIGDKALAGYKEPNPVVFVSFYPEDSDEYEDLKLALKKLKLNDSSFTFEPDFSEVLGRGFRCGFLGRLHFEIITERLEKDFGVKTVNSFPSVAYEVINKKGEKVAVQNPKDFPDEYLEAKEPVVELRILTPSEHLGAILNLKKVFRLSDLTTETLPQGLLIKANLPLAELILDFDDRLKSVSEGYASFSYEIKGLEKANIVKVEILVAGSIVPGLTRLVHRDDLERESRQMVEKLKRLLPKQQFAQAVQAAALGRIIARETIPALKKDVTGHLYGGDRSRKMKLWKKQKKGKAKLKEMGTVTVPPEIFRELLKRG